MTSFDRELSDLIFRWKGHGLDIDEMISELECQTDGLRDEKESMGDDQ